MKKFVLAVAFCASGAALAGPVASVSPAVITLPDYSISANNLSTGSFLLANVGDAPLQVQRILAVYGSVFAPHYLRIDPTGCSVLPILLPGESCDINVTLSTVALPPVLGLKAMSAAYTTNGGSGFTSARGTVTP